MPVSIAGQIDAHPGHCPACTRLRDRFRAGELRLVGIRAEERAEILRVLRNEEERAPKKNRLERIMGVEQEEGNWKIETTTEKLAQRLARSVKKARGGNVDYKWGHNTKFVRVVWQNKII